MSDKPKLIFGLTLFGLGGMYAFTGGSIESTICVVGAFIVLGMME